MTPGHVCEVEEKKLTEAILCCKESCPKPRGSGGYKIDYCASVVDPFQYGNPFNLKHLCVAPARWTSWCCIRGPPPLDAAFYDLGTTAMLVTPNVVGGTLCGFVIL